MREGFADRVRRASRAVPKGNPAYKLKLTMKTATSEVVWIDAAASSIEDGTGAPQLDGRLPQRRCVFSRYKTEHGTYDAASAVNRRRRLKQDPTDDRSSTGGGEMSRWTIPCSRNAAHCALRRRVPKTLSHAPARTDARLRGPSPRLLLHGLRRQAPCWAARTACQPPAAEVIDRTSRCNTAASMPGASPRRWCGARPSRARRAGTQHIPFVEGGVGGGGMTLLRRPNLTSSSSRSIPVSSPDLRLCPRMEDSAGADGRLEPKPFFRERGEIRAHPNCHRRPLIDYQAKS